MAFRDYEKAFDSMETSGVMKALRRHGVEELYVKILEYIFKESIVPIKLHTVSNEIPIHNMMRQGDIVSPKLFKVVLKEVFKSLE